MRIDDAARLPRHLPALDGVRGVAIAMVLVTHSLYNSDIPKGQILLRSGWAGVDLFFVLSGFLITGCLLDAKGKACYFRNFYARRTLRIMPLYLGFLSLVVFTGAGVWALGTAERHAALGDHQAWFWVHGSNWLMAKESGWFATPLNHLWSLAVEEQFYLVWPLLVFVAGRRTLVAIAAGILVASPILRHVLLTKGVTPLQIYVMTVTRLDGLAAGTLLAIAVRSDLSHAVIRRHSGRLFAVSGAAILTLFFTQKWFMDHFYPQTIRYGYTLCALCCAGLVGLSVTSAAAARLNRALSIAPLRFLGRHSYCIYLIHQPVTVALLGAFLLLPDPLLSKLFRHLPHFVFVGTLLVTLSASYLIWHLYEKPFLRLKVYFEAKGAAPSQAVTAAGPERLAA